MKQVLIIGIGAGDPEQITVQAVNALNRADVLFVMDKGPAKAKLAAYRKEICRRYIRHDRFRVVEAESPERDVAATDYDAAVGDLNRRKQDVFERLIVEEIPEGGCGAFLTWGDPSLYDSTIRNVEAVARKGHRFEYEVIPGISSIQMLAARHRTTLNRIGQSVAVTTGRRLAEGWPADSDSVVVMLDAGDSYKRFAEQDVDIVWGAYLGTPDEILVAGKIRDVAPEIERKRAAARRANGWIMDCYLMRRRKTD
ncbi:precorrin-6A synthase (deacetylating) [Desertibaculum subflavum]|uniref:precorrin-6A synthase (deacetylating) n=1 Tax=Desertibaculum subflavum TaxID=2268458 RepID=UPI000E668527